MLLVENVANRLREWRDNTAEDPDLVPRFRRVWQETPARVALPPARKFNRLLLSLRPGHVWGGNR